MSVRYTTYMLVLAAGLEMACRPGPSTLPIVAAAERGDTAELRALLASGVEVDAVDDQEATALIPAARGGRVGVLTVLLEAGGNPNHLDGRLGRNPARRGWTPLVHAVHTNQTAAVQTLRNFGADPNLPARGGDTPLVMAAGYGRTSLVELLLAHGANPALQTRTGWPHAVGRRGDGECGYRPVHDRTVPDRNRQGTARARGPVAAGRRVLGPHGHPIRALEQLHGVVGAPRSRLNPTPAWLLIGKSFDALVHRHAKGFQSHRHQVVLADRKKRHPSAASCRTERRARPKSRR